MNRHDTEPPEDDDIARLLRAAGPREQLPTGMQERWEQQFRAELQPVLARRGRRRRNWIMGLCASVLVAAGAIALLQQPSSNRQPQMLVTRVIGDSQWLPPQAAAQPVVAGQQLAAGSRVTTGAEGTVALQYGHYQLRLNRDTQLVFLRDELLLEAGELYASDYGASGAGGELTIRTAHGVIRDIGTQFTVLAGPEATVTTVRRGAVIVDTGREELRATAGDGSASRLIVDSARQVRQEQVAASGADWDWIYLGAPPYRLEGSSAYDFLRWSTGESGQRLAFASPGAETLARTTRLHGDISDLNPEQAVQPVLASTDLVATRSGNNTLLVSVNRSR